MPLLPFDLKSFDYPRRALIDFMNRCIALHSSGIPIPYIWGGSNLETGVDCSGLVIIGLQRAGILPLNYDNTAAGLRTTKVGLGRRYTKTDTDPILPGDLVFFGLNRVTHVGMIYNRERNDFIMVEAAGGDSKVTTKEKAYAAHAWVCPSLVSRRKDLVGFRCVIK